MQEEQEEQEEMIKTGKPEKRRPSGFKNGVIIGLVLGLLITGTGAGVGIRAQAVRRRAAPDVYRCQPEDP